MVAMSKAEGTVRFAVLCLIVGCFMLPAAAGAATVWNVSHVAGDENYTSLLDLPLISEGDTIHIWGAEGEPYEGGIVIGMSGVTIKRWEGSPTRPIITNSSHTTPAINVTGDGVTLQGLNISGNSLRLGNGAGVRVTGTVDTRIQGFTVTDCVFSGNAATSGAVSLEYVDNSTIVDSIFADNMAAYGSGMYLSRSNNATLTDTTFTGNTAQFYGGGAWFLFSTSPILTNTTFAGNTADIHGGGVSFSSSTNPILTETTFTGNTAPDGGGAYFGNSAGPTLTDTTFVNNTATTGFGGGGAHFYMSNSATLTGTGFANNTAGNGGGVCIYKSASATLMDTVFTNNKATNNGGGAYFHGSSGAAVKGSTSTNNTADRWGGGACFFDFTGAAIINCHFDNPTNIYAGGSGAVLNGNRSSSTGTNIAGGPYLGGNLWLTDPAQNISEWGTDADFDGICDEAFIISNDDGSPFGTDHLPLVYGGTAVVNSAPAGASIHLDGVGLARTTNTSLYLPAGGHDLTVALNGYVTPENRTVTIAAGQTVPVSFALAPVCGSLTVSSVPEGARIIFNGMATDNTTNTTLAEVLPGNHTVTVSLDGYVTPENQTVMVVANETTTVSFTLDPVPTPAPRPHGSGGGCSHVSAAAAGNIPAGGHASFAVQGTAIYSVTVTAGEPIPEIHIAAETTGLPSGIDAPPGTVYEYAELTLYRTTDAALASATLNFAVPKAWLAERGFAPEGVVLYRYYNSTWQPLPTEMIREDATRYSFTAEGPGFSLFAIAAEGGAIVAGEPTAQPTATPAPTAAATAPAEQTPAPQQSPVPWELAAFAAGTAYLLKRRRL
ncbi:PEGA domain-containing protein [Methanoculleus sp.]|uniref:PEGA domain-containing protein n=1 Tax=Methanoculleus sp. TaxID=90427 RepID=UPI002FC9BE8D